MQKPGISKTIFRVFSLAKINFLLLSGKSINNVSGAITNSYRR